MATIHDGGSDDDAGARRQLDELLKLRKSVILCIYGSKDDRDAILAASVGDDGAKRSGPTAAYQRKVFWFQFPEVMNKPAFNSISALMNPTNGPKNGIAHVISSPDPRKKSARSAGERLSINTATDVNLVDNAFLRGEI